MDLTDSIVPKSDQLNADDLMTGPRTVTITEVLRGTAEQPVNVVLAEFGPGRPFKPSKSMRRIMVAAWGPEAKAYAGRRMTIYRDPKIRFGGEEVGGIRISHLSHIEKAMSVALTVTRGKRSPFIVQPLPETAPASEKAGGAAMSKLVAAFASADIEDRAERLTFCVGVIGRDIESAAELTPDEIVAVIDRIERDLDPEVES